MILLGDTMEQVNTSTADTEFSILISRILNLEGPSSFALKMHRSFSYLDEYLQEELQDIQMLCCGSTTEGCFTSTSDVDIMWVQNGAIAVPGAQEELLDKGYIFSVDTSNVRDGFCKLKLLKNKDEDGEAGMWREDNNLHDSLEQTEEGSVYLSSEKFIMCCYAVFDTDDTRRYIGIGKSIEGRHHGPCVEVDLNEKSDHTQKTVDFPFVIKCSEWPEEAAEWITRPRPKGWPSLELINNLKKMPCFLLPVGDQSSETYSMEWRFAFVPTERELIWSLNDTQIHCFALLKLLKKCYLDPLNSDQLNSFMLKTILLWQCENSGIEQWTPENLIQCVLKCLETLKNCVKSLHLSHFLLRKRNLLFSKFSNKCEQNAVIEKITDIQNNIAICIIQAASGERILKTLESLWELSHGHMPDVISNGMTQIDLKNKAAEITNWKSMHHILLHSFQDVVTIVKDVPVSGKKFKRVAEELKKNSNIHQLAKEKIVHFLALQIGKRFLSLAGLLDDIELKDGSIQNINLFLEGKLDNMETKKRVVRYMRTLEPDYESDADAIRSIFVSGKFAYIVKNAEVQGPKYYFEEGNDLDKASGPLHLATFYYRCGDYETALAIINKVISNKQKLLTVRNSDTPFLPYPSYNTQIWSLGKKDDVAFDLLFTQSDVLFVPAAVQFECSLLEEPERCEFQPFVYANYLQFQVYLDMKDDKECDLCIRNFVDLMQTDTINITADLDRFFRELKQIPSVRLQHRIQADLSQNFNLLGFCYSKVNNYDKAIECFRKSLQIRPSFRNAAAYHLCIMFVQIMENKPVKYEIIYQRSRDAL